MTLPPETESVPVLPWTTGFGAHVETEGRPRALDDRTHLRVSQNADRVVVGNGIILGEVTSDAVDALRQAEEPATEDGAVGAEVCDGPTAVRLSSYSQPTKCSSPDLLRPVVPVAVSEVEYRSDFPCEPGRRGHRARVPGKRPVDHERPALVRMASSIRSASTAFAAIAFLPCRMPRPSASTVICVDSTLSLVKERVQLLPYRASRGNRRRCARNPAAPCRSGASGPPPPPAEHPAPSSTRRSVPKHAHARPAPPTVISSAMRRPYQRRPLEFLSSEWSPGEGRPPLPSRP